MTAIVTLLKMSSDTVTMRQTLLALCLLNAEPENHMAILQQGVINILQTLCSSTDSVHLSRSVIRAIGYVDALTLISARDLLRLHQT